MTFIINYYHIWTGAYGHIQSIITAHSNVYIQLLGPESLKARLYRVGVEIPESAWREVVSASGGDERVDHMSNEAFVLLMDRLGMRRERGAAGIFKGDGVDSEVS